jgi:Enterobacteriaceae phage serine recombinase
MGREGPGYISPDVQRESIERWAACKGVDVAEWHLDEDWSGGTHERPGLERAIDRAVTGETGGIVSWKIDRFSRYTEGGLRDLRRLEEAGARLAFVVEDIDTSGPMGKFVYAPARNAASFADVGWTIHFPGLSDMVRFVLFSGVTLLVAVVAGTGRVAYTFVMLIIGAALVYAVLDLVDYEIVKRKRRG